MIDLHEVLHRYWGYREFRPRQEEVVRTLLAGRDAAVIMPTGGGKSLCYQLPAVALGKTAIVVSPLIALMQDQAEQLRQIGISAAALNSSADSTRQREILSAATRNEYRLVYLSPERIAMPQTVEWLRRVPVSFFAIDEAHCISEWGHEFRPEYRQLSSLRDNFPDKPIAAFTASATQRVRHDILQQLRLRDPGKFILSFDRPNLRYMVRACDSKSQPKYLLNAVRAHPAGNLIIYAPTIARVESTVDFLIGNGIPAVAYHAQMPGEERRANQERWMSDEVRVLVGTIAFGLGINKPAVRAVIHLSLPKSLEQYYQEAGRAGRDGLESDCALLWQPQDKALLVHFIKQIQNADEQQRAWQRYRVMIGYAESTTCRHRQICLHFGENRRQPTCDACDVCAPAPEWLSDAGSPRVRRERQRKAVAAPVTPTAAAVDPELAAFLKQWRTAEAREYGVPSYVIMHDSSLEELCRVRPRSESELLGITGFGRSKVEKYGATILDVLRRFDGGERVTATTAPISAPEEATRALLEQGLNFEQIAEARQRKLATVVDTVASLVERGVVTFRVEWFAPGHLDAIRDAAARLGVARAKPIKEAVPDEITYGEIRLVLGEMRRESTRA